MHKEILIIGAGQCGLAAGRLLQIKNKDFLILEKNREVGETWKKRYDSLKLFTPAAYSALPGLPLALDPKTRPTKNQIADYFTRYAEHFDLPVSVNEGVLSITKENGLFKVKTTLNNISAEKVILANGFCASPQVPEWAENLSIPYLHSSAYRNPLSVKGNKVLVVGAGNSAAQIAAELTKYYEVHWSTWNKPRFSPLHLFGKNVLWYAEKLGKLEKPVSEKKIKKGEAIFLYDDLKKSLKKTHKRKKVVEAKGDLVTFEDGKSEPYKVVLFATGFKPDFSFIRIDDFEYDLDALRAQQGISKVVGLYMLGIPYQRTRSSHLIYGSQRDAAYIVEKLSQTVTA
ncbi:MAG TPA: NAD(P)/FAD-dependent oxidoreductase [Cyclobacteriaceae bacterium]|nr:NAD(P)/FAD-dependent oxidoreductase [Cyclobacteriaceae bacterium]